MEYYQFLFEGIPNDKRDILVALLNDIGFTGFEEADDSLKAFINIADLDQNDLDVVIATTDAKYSRSIIQEINWNEKWETSFEPVTVFEPGTAVPFVYVRAAFHQADTNAKIDIVITPKMSFGTGHHATTYLMAEQMSQIDFKNKTVIDFGTGTAVLAILAEKLGAANIIAIDNDDWSINNARENITANNCRHITLVRAETIDTAEKAAVILANINLNIITANLSVIKAAAEPAATLLFSGIMLHDEPLIISALKTAGIEIKEILYKNGWLAILTKS
ncbi:MAG: 50S ribosomal protein L11 methyltransferase [Ferruginibacter sp.]